MILALFDLDGTILNGDSDKEWNTFLIEKGIVKREFYYAKNEEYFRQYKEGILNIYEYQNFALSLLKKYTLNELEPLRIEYLQDKIKPLVKPQALDLIAWHKKQNHTILIVTTTNRFVVEKIAEHLKMDDLIACDPEVVNDRFTGNIVGTPSFREGKLLRVNQWINESGKKFSLKDSYYYGDSINDFFVMEAVGNPIVIDGDEKILEIASKRNWSAKSLID